MKAYIRPELLEAGEYPPASIEITPEEWQALEFDYSIDDYPEFNGTPEQYNIVLGHPSKGCFWAYSIDFDFKECKSVLDDRIKE